VLTCIKCLVLDVFELGRGVQRGEDVPVVGLVADRCGGPPRLPRCVLECVSKCNLVQ
jgi:hypothetical protein